MLVFHVQDMTCGHCASTLARAIAQVDGTARPEFDMASRRLTVRDPSADAAELQSAMEEAGYHPVLEAAATRPAARSGCGCGCGPRKTAELDAGQAAAAAGGSCCT